MDWLRLYDEALDDPKLQRLPDRMFKRWFNLLCLSNRGQERGTLPCTEDIAFSLRISEKEAIETIQFLVNAGLVDDDGNGSIYMHGWKKRQRQSDDSTDRVKRFRNGNVTESETELKRCEKQVKTVPRARATEQNRTETEQKQNIPPPPSGSGRVPVVDDGFAEFYRIYPRKKAPERAKAAWKKACKRAPPGEIIAALKAQLEAGEFAEDPSKRPYPATWLNAGSWEDELTRSRKPADPGSAAYHDKPAEPVPRPVRLHLESKISWADVGATLSQGSLQTWWKPVLLIAEKIPGEIVVDVPNDRYAAFWREHWPAVSRASEKAGVT